MRQLKIKLGTNPSREYREKFNSLVQKYNGRNVMLTRDEEAHISHGVKNQKKVTSAVATHPNRFLNAGGKSRRINFGQRGLNEPYVNPNRICFVVLSYPQWVRSKQFKFMLSCENKTTFQILQELPNVLLSTKNHHNEAPKQKAYTLFRIDELRKQWFQQFPNPNLDLNPNPIKSDQLIFIRGSPRYIELGLEFHRTDQAEFVKRFFQNTFQTKDFKPFEYYVKSNVETFDDDDGNEIEIESFEVLPNLQQFRKTTLRQVFERLNHHVFKRYLRESKRISEGRSSWDNATPDMRRQLHELSTNLQTDLDVFSKQIQQEIFKSVHNFQLRVRGPNVLHVGCNCSKNPNQLTLSFETNIPEEQASNQYYAKLFCGYLNSLIKNGIMLTHHT